MIPTNAIRPLTATAAAVPSVAATTSSEARCAGTSTPRLAASVSPRLRTSSDTAEDEDHPVATTTYGASSATSLQPELGSAPRIHE